ncbi:MAG: SET domain-containing protein [Gammaproteobacteria bacterium]|nr:MAG: SET domain-containing protein [Gammaproteobacteria bacterium]
MKYRRFSPHFVIKDGIHGLGVFTTADIKKGKVLFKLKGTILDHPTRTSVQVGKYQHIEDIIGAHVNHCCQPNTKVYKRSHVFKSSRNIKKGEELTFDYSKNEASLAAPFRCECCGKKVTGQKK